MCNIKIQGEVRYILYDVNTKEKYISNWQKNIIPTVGRTAIARRLINAASVANEGIITYAALGTGQGVVNNDNTILTTELIRKTFTVSENSNNVITIRTFFTTAEANGTLWEYGLFGEDAGAGADSGTLFERIVFASAIVKTTLKTLSLESVLTIS